MREIKVKVETDDPQDIVFFRHVPQYQAMVVANRFLLLLVSSLMLVIFILGFILIPDNDPLDSYSKATQSSALTAIKDPALSAEVTQLKGQIVGLLSSSIESKLKALEESIKMGSVVTSLGTVQELKSDIRTLRAYSESAGSESEKSENKVQENEALTKEVAQLKGLVYFMLALCGLVVVSIGGFFIRNYYLARLNFPKKNPV